MTLKMKIKLRKNMSLLAQDALAEDEDQIKMNKSALANALIRCGS